MGWKMKRSVVCIAIAMMVLWGWMGCSSDEGYSAYERMEASFLAQLDGEISAVQWWRTAVTLQVAVTTDARVKIWLMSSANGGTLYDYKVVNATGIVALTAPQGQGNTLYLVSECNRILASQPVVLSGKAQETVTLDTRNQTRMLADDEDDRAATRVTTDRSSLYGYSVIGNGTYYQFNREQLADFYDMMEKMVKESANAKIEMGLNCDYELESNGPFTITWAAGNCMSRTEHVLGYYYHSPGTYEDIKYVDISETEVYDYIDGIAKVQYQVNEEAAARYGVEANRWYDANFDMYDRWGMSSPVVARQGDDAYNAMGVYERYGHSMTALRGISFLVDVPKGMHLGFYDRWETQDAPEQYDRLMKYGVPPYTSREKFKGTSYSAEGMNSYNEGGYFRSFIEPHDHVTWMGMENDVTGGDLDCNDVIFGVTVEMDIYKPSIVEPDLAPKGEYDDRMPWTIAYEDVAREADFDFNDAVIRLMPDYEKEECCVTVMAAGSEARMYLHYDGPDGDQNLGELHELLGGASDKKINTTSTVASTPFVEVDCVKWPKEYTMNSDAARFYIEIQRGTCTDCTDVITLADTPGEMPEALLVAGEWQWPKEGTHIFTAYNVFPLWTKDATKVSYWSWYSSAKTGTCVSY